MTAVGHVTVRAVPSALKINVKLQALPVPAGLLIVSVVMFALSETRNTLPFSKFSVSVPLEMDGVVYVSA